MSALDESQVMTQVGTPYWTAPEILKAEAYSEKADMYSLAILLLQMLRGQVARVRQST